MKKDFFDYFEYSEDYPKNIAERGVSENSYYCYISTTFLNGMINYVKPFWGCILERYEDWTEEKVDKYQEKLKSQQHTDFSIIPDDVLILAESDNDYWFFWSDKDVSDSAIGRFSKDGIAKEDVISSLEQWISNNPQKEGSKNPFTQIISEPIGWMSF